MRRGLRIGGALLLVVVFAGLGAAVAVSSSDDDDVSPSGSAGLAGDGTVFLLMEDRGAAVKVTAASGTVDARAPIDGAGDDLVLVQHGEGALVHDRREPKDPRGQSFGHRRPRRSPHRS